MDARIPVKQRLPPCLETMSVRCLPVFLTIFITSMLVAFVVGMWMPDYRHFLIEEDSLVESLSALFFLVAFFVGLALLIRGGGNRLLLAVVACLGLLGFLDELSFGERPFELEMPYLRGVQIDAAHDLFTVVYAIARDWIRSQPVTGLLVVAIVGLATVLAMRRYRARFTRALMNYPNREAVIFACIFAALIGFALVIDLNIVQHNVLFSVEEMFELNAAIALLFCAWSLRGTG